MTVRGDVTIEYTDSPRRFIVDSPSTELTIQDLVDTSQESQDDLANLDDRNLLVATGKQDLGGGTKVSTTVQTLDMDVAFESRKSWAQVGTVTTPDATGRVLTDSAATFISNGVVAGTWAVNRTDNSICTVTRVINETQLYTDVLGGGGDNQWDAGDAYSLLNVTVCEISGGNYTAVDKVGATVFGVRGSAGVTVVVAKASSGTLQEQADIQFSSFGGGVTYDALSANTGTGYPVGTPRAPVNNFPDALSILSSRGLGTIFVIGDATIGGGLNFSSVIFVGESQTKTTLTIDPSANVTNAEFTDATVTGTLDGGAKLKNCLINTLNYVDGFVEQCVLGNATITLSGAGTAHFLDCWSGVPGSEPTVDLGGSGSPLSMRNYNGAVILTNKSGADQVTVDLNSGKVTLNASITNGTIEIRGVGQLEDNSVGATVDRTHLLEAIQLTDVWQQKGLDKDNPATYAPTQTTAGGITQDIVEAPANTFTVTRQ